MVNNGLDFKAALVTKMKYQRERDWWKKGKHSKCKTAHPWAPHFHLLPQHPSHFSIHASITSLPLSSMAFRGTGISRSPLDNKLTAVENGFFQFGCSQSHYIVIAELHDCLPVWMLVQEKSWGTRSGSREGDTHKERVGRRHLKKERERGCDGHERENETEESDIHRGRGKNTWIYGGKG